MKLTNAICVLFGITNASLLTELDMGAESCTTEACCEDYGEWTAYQDNPNAFYCDDCLPFGGEWVIDPNLG